MAVFRFSGARTHTTASPVSLRNPSCTVRIKTAILIPESCKASSCTKSNGVDGNRLHTMLLLLFAFNTNIRGIGSLYRLDHDGNKAAACIAPVRSAVIGPYLVLLTRRSENITHNAGRLHATKYDPQTAWCVPMASCPSAGCCGH